MKESNGIWKSVGCIVLIISGFAAFGFLAFCVLLKGLNGMG